MGLIIKNRLVKQIFFNKFPAFEKFNSWGCCATASVWLILFSLAPQQSHIEHVVLVLFTVCFHLLMNLYAS